MERTEVWDMGRGDEEGDRAVWTGLWIFMSFCLVLAILGFFYGKSEGEQAKAQKRGVTIAGAGDEGPRQVWEGE